MNPFETFFACLVLIAAFLCAIVWYGFWLVFPIAIIKYIYSVIRKNKAKTDAIQKRKKWH